MQKAVWLISQIVPWLLRVAWAGINASFESLFAAFREWPQSAEVLSDKWTFRAITEGFPSRYDFTLKRILRVGAWIGLLLGWFLGAFLTVWLVRAIF